jgi:hypothetical protein
VDGTKGASLPSGLAVVLDGLDANHQPVAERTTTPDSSGHFAFADVPGGGATYTTKVSYGGATYSNPVDTSTSPSSPAPVTITIYEPTTSDSTLRIDSANWLFEAIDPENAQIVMLEMIDLRNDGDKTYVGDHRGDPGSDAPGVLPRTIRLYLPTGASQMTPESGLDPKAILPMANGYVDTAPIPPGATTIAFTYRVVYADGAAEIQKAVPYPTNTLRVLVPDVGLELRSDHLTDGGKVTLDGRSYQVLTAANLSANTTVTVDMLGLPATPAGRLDPNQMLIAGLIAVGVAVLAAVFFALRRAPERSKQPVADRSELLTALASLDDRYAAGQLEDLTYRLQRADLKRQLVALTVGEAPEPEMSGAPR